ncbi:MAG: RHS repeat-associated core domain-containing protein, partial [Alphaproteobacteria bacterium]|nr:RHS repeat-associated core domain-containing protein [Alphaproteobacteria bacterium]
MLLKHKLIQKLSTPPPPSIRTTTNHCPIKKRNSFMLSLLQALAKILLLNNIIASHFSPQIKKIFSTGFTQSLLSLIFIVGLLGKFFFFYDGLGRRIQTKSQGNTINYYYDPEVEFLELGHSVNGNRQWNLHGPDRSGVYGGAQGIGGLESCFTENTKTSVGIVNNYFGDVVGLLSSGTFTPYPSALGAYGPMPGSSVDQALQPQWRGHYLDPTGFYYMGARYYDPQGGRFISPDPLGHSSSLGLYDYCNGDPVNGLDPDGRCVEGASAGWANGNGQFAGTYDSSQASSQLAYGLGWTVGGALGTVNGMAASLITRPLAAMGQSFNEVTNFAEENLNLAPGSLTAATFMFAPLAVAGEV